MNIHPETRVGALLEAHPELEEALASFAPAFARLKNPLLRRTLARVATLDQAARAAGVPLPDLLAFVRERLGIPPEDGGTPGTPSRTRDEAPAWYQPRNVVLELDAAPLLAAGEHPLARVRAALAEHPAGAIIAVTTPFEPAPLLDRLGAEGVLVWCRKEGDTFRTCLRKP